ncbi:hypothetical protein [Victivallis sp. Marseille-Q1083]|uniref:hypothetical protein n=1 Tax=Victivallis sp. Marseille-Q1083 TaxID=2717288 RepID=UPI00158BA729|nr:hypothetical protein [Victivallis sp. Marseille-Q1083]
MYLNHWRSTEKSRSSLLLLAAMLLFSFNALLHPLFHCHRPSSEPELLAGVAEKSPEWTAGAGAGQFRFTAGDDLCPICAGLFQAADCAAVALSLPEPASWNAAGRLLPSIPAELDKNTCARAPPPLPASCL